MSDPVVPGLPSDWQKLVKMSRQTRQNAFAPFSNYKVGAAVLTERGDIFTGCNVENSSYGLTVCAERSAVCAAVAAGQTEIVAVVVSLEGVAVPCGTCRQFLYEFNPEMIVLLDDLAAADGETPECVWLEQLLPRGFRLARS